MGNLCVVVYLKILSFKFIVVCISFFLGLIINVDWIRKKGGN